MKLKNIAAALAVMGASLASGSASAYIIQDGWSLNDGTNLISNIGHLGLSSGGATVNQEVNAAGNPFVGAEFREYGGIFSTNYTIENLQGFNDFSVFPNPPPSLPIPLTVQFSGLAGTVTAYNSGTGELDYAFTSGIGTIGIYAGALQLASLDMASPSGGDLADFFGQAQTAGQSTLLLNFSAFLNGFNIGLADPYGLGIPTTYGGPEDLYLQIQTTNKIGVPFSVVAPCSFDNTLDCRSILVTSDGSADLLRIPEPGTLALAGIALVGLAGLRRRKEVK